MGGSQSYIMQVTSSEPRYPHFLSDTFHVCTTGACVAYGEKFQPINKFNTRVTAHPKLKVCARPTKEIYNILHV